MLERDETAAAGVHEAPGATEAATAEASGAPEAPAPSRRRFPLRLVAGLAAAAVIVLVALPVFSTLQPGYYGRYPDLRVRMENWRVSTHARVPCSGCHVDPGAKGMMAFAGRSIPAFYSQLLRGPKPTNLLAVPGVAACRKCHTGYRQVSPNGDLLIPHRAHVEVLHLDCAVCHKDLVHSANARGFNRPEMELCLKVCHDGTRAGDECVKCHTRKQVPESHRSKDWLLVHSSKAESKECGQCHEWSSADFCRECHAKRPASHVGNWKKGHAVAAKRRGKGCVVCHGGEKFCKTCHD